MASYAQTIRSGLPRVPGGEPWPPAGVTVGSAPPGAGPGTAASDGSAAESSAGRSETFFDIKRTQAGIEELIAGQGAAPAGSAPAGSVPAGPVPAGAALRRGLPRVPGGEPWPPAGTAAPSAVTEPAAEPAAPCHPQFDGAPHGPGGPFGGGEAHGESPHGPGGPHPHGAPHDGADPHGGGAPHHHHHHHHHHRQKADAGERTLAQRVGRGALWGAGIVVVAGVLVLAAKGVTTLPGVPEFLERFPGQYEPAVETADGFPAWVRWSHFLNLFFMVLIVRTGLQMRRRQKPPAFFTPKRGGRKISLDLWLHTSIDVLWFANGVAFVVLLFVSGHWARIVPTSWEVFPNAVSAALQYATLDWPLEDGWVNYNSLQQLMYFLVVFVAAPLAAVTGLRMSEWWPQGDTWASRVFPTPVARAVHYPVMLFFVLFTVIHVFLVLTTGALRNLNHMFAGNPGAGWLGFWMFAAGLAAVVAVWFAARPIVIAPIASLFGRVSNR